MNPYAKLIQPSPLSFSLLKSLGCLQELNSVSRVAVGERMRSSGQSLLKKCGIQILSSLHVLKEGNVNSIVHRFCLFKLGLIQGGLSEQTLSTTLLPIHTWTLIHKNDFSIFCNHNYGVQLMSSSKVIGE